MLLHGVEIIRSRADRNSKWQACYEFHACAHSLDPAVPDQFLVCSAHGNPARRPVEKARYTRGSLWSPCHHHVADLLYMVLLSSNTDQQLQFSTTEFYWLLQPLKDKKNAECAVLQYGVHKQRQLTPTCGCRTRNWYSWAQLLVAGTDASSTDGRSPTYFLGI